MKKILLAATLLISSALYKSADAQVNIDVNIGSQPVWGPEGYDYVNYYYFPDIDAYYSVPQQQFIFFDGRHWVYDYALPGRFSNFDLYRSYKVVINDPNPFLRGDYYRNRYRSYRGVYGRQHIIYNSHNPRYYVIQNHPEHQRWMETNRRSGNYDRRFDNRGNYGRGNDGRRFDNDRRGDNNRRFDSRRGDNGRSYSRRG